MIQRRFTCLLLAALVVLATGCGSGEDPSQAAPPRAEEISYRYLPLVIPKQSADSVIKTYPMVWQKDLQSSDRDIKEIAEIFQNKFAVAAHYYVNSRSYLEEVVCNGFGDLFNYIKTKHPGSLANLKNRLLQLGFLTTESRSGLVIVNDLTEKLDPSMAHMVVAKLQNDRDIMIASYASNIFETHFNQKFGSGFQASRMSDTNLFFLTLLERVRQEFHTLRDAKGGFVIQTRPIAEITQFETIPLTTSFAPVAISFNQAYRQTLLHLLQYDAGDRKAFSRDRGEETD